MSSNPSEATVAVEREEGVTSISSVINSDTPPLETSCPRDEGEQIDEFEDQSNEDAHKQLVVYDPITNGGADVEPISFHPPRLPMVRKSFPNHSSRVSPSVGAFTVQCASCFKWRLIPTKEKYEELREHIIEKPFYCETAREWRPEISCENTTDISPDGSRIWAIDKPSIAQPPPGWQRILRIRGEGGSKFADVYYAAPTGKRLRSMVEVQRFMLEHPEYVEAGVKLTQFSFQVPRPLNENYVRKRPPRLSSACDDVAQLPESSHVANPLALLGPEEDTNLRLGTFSESTMPPGSVSRPARKKPKIMHKNENGYGHQQVLKMEEQPYQWRNGML